MKKKTRNIIIIISIVSITLLIFNFLNPNILSITSYNNGITVDCNFWNPSGYPGEIKSVSDWGNCFISIPPEIFDQIVVQGDYNRVEFCVAPAEWFDGNIFPLPLGMLPLSLHWVGEGTTIDAYGNAKNPFCDELILTYQQEFPLGASNNWIPTIKLPEPGMFDINPRGTGEGVWKGTGLNYRWFIGMYGEGKGYFVHEVGGFVNIQEAVDLCIGVSSDDGNPCTADSCRAATGEVRNVPISDGNSCPGGTCEGGFCASPPNPQAKLSDANVYEGFSGDSVGFDFCIDNQGGSYYQGNVEVCIFPNTWITAIPLSILPLGFGSSNYGCEQNPNCNQYSVSIGANEIACTSTFVEVPSINSGNDRCSNLGAIYIGDNSLYTVVVGVSKSLTDNSYNSWDKSAFTVVSSGIVDLCEGKLIVDDVNPCTLDLCDSSTGIVSYDPVADGTWCLGGTCQYGSCVSPEGVEVEQSPFEAFISSHFFNIVMPFLIVIGILIGVIIYLARRKKGRRR